MDSHVTLALPTDLQN